MFPCDAVTDRVSALTLNAGVTVQGSVTSKVSSASPGEICIEARTSDHAPMAVSRMIVYVTGYVYTLSLDSTVAALTCTAGQAAIFDGTDWGCKTAAVERSIKAVRNTVLETTGFVGQEPSMAISHDGNPIISHWDQTNSDLEVYVCSEKQEGRHAKYFVQQLLRLIKLPIMRKDQKKSTVTVIGCGYVGLTTAACLAKLGHRVIGVESSDERMLKLQKGQAPFYETGLDELTSSGLVAGLLSFTQNLKKAAQQSEIVFVCVPTPSLKDGSADLSIVQAVVEELSGSLSAEAIIVLKSTVPIGTNAEVDNWVNRNDIHIASNPEFLQAGRAVETFQNPDRIVIGAGSAKVIEKIASLYEGLQAPIVRTDAQSAELIKYASNTYLATRLSFVNTIATLCEQSGANATTVLEGMGLDQRIGPAFLQPGPGWGGSCFPKDTRALIAAAEKKNVDAVLLQATLRANENRFDHIVARVEELLEGGLRGAVVAQWGLAFKAGTDDLRESPALQIAQRLLAKGAKLQVFDPLVDEIKETEMLICRSALEALNEADVLLVVTEWPEFAEVSPEKVVDLMEQPRIVDARGLLDREGYIAAGAEIVSVGISR